MNYVQRRRRAMMAMAGSSEKTLKKLASVSIDAQTGRTISIPATDEIKSCETLYLVFDNVVCDQADWIYVSLNASATNSGYALGYTSKNSTFDDAYTICRTKTADLSTKTQKPYMILFGGTIGGKTDGSTFTALYLTLYTSVNTFTSGTVEIWGWV